MDEMDEMGLAQADGFTVVLARADEFTVEREGLWVHIMDGEDVVRLTMPAIVWYQLCAQSIHEEES